MQRAGWRGRGLGRGRSAAAGAVAGAEGGGGASLEACAGTDGPTDRRAEGEGRRRGRYLASARAARGGAAARGAGARGEGGGRGGGGPGGGSARGVGLRPLPWQRKRSPGLPSPSFSFLPNQRKINTREGKTIAGPPGTRRAPSSHVWGEGRGWNGEWRPHLGASSRFAPAEGGATRGAGARWEAEGIPRSEAFGESIAGTIGLPAIARLCAGKLRWRLRWRLGQGQTAKVDRPGPGLGARTSLALSPSRFCGGRACL